MTRLWDRGEPLDAVVARLTVGRDPQLDLQLVAHDALASAAHAVMLESIGILETGELALLTSGLRSIAREARAGEFVIELADEDGHTAIENRLTESLGDAGRKIHTGRSRNDQILAAIRLWGRQELLTLHAEALALVERVFALAERHKDTTIPGYSHTRQAMPTTLGHWLAAHAEGLLDDLPWLERAYEHLNRSPLGSASGFGVALELDRLLVSELLGFASVQPNTLAVQNDRGKSEWLALGAAVTVGNDLGRMASDLIWFSSDELKFVKLPDVLTTGSSIMPQKRNPDVLELIRASAAGLRGRHTEIGNIYAQLASGYHRDLQLTKAPFLEGMPLVGDLLRAMVA
ncbi:MAG: lyase family protein, partial [Acidobacteriota bacterium]|nr:lyase family protein [Acidobacteriota bacterium]